MKRSLGGCGVVAAGLLIVVGLAVLTLVGPYNRLVALEEDVETAWSQVENVYQRRADLIPNLVSVVEGAADFERGTLQDVVEARSQATGINIEGVPTEEELAQFQAAQGQLSGALSRLLVVVEDYPQLTATDTFRDLQAQLEGTENRIAVERRRYNETVRDYNVTRRQFPTVLVANLFGFGDKPLFEAEAGAEQAPDVEFDFSDDEG